MGKIFGVRRVFALVTTGTSRWSYEVHLRHARLHLILVLVCKAVRQANLLELATGGATGEGVGVATA